MPTRGRAAWLPQAYRLWARQTYEAKELVIVVDEDDVPTLEYVRQLSLQDQCVRLVSCAPGLTLGAKRNRGCAGAQGPLLLHWDDDDWYGPHRTRAQVQCLQTSGAPFCRLSFAWLLDLERGKAYHRQGSPFESHSTTIAFTRQAWLEVGGYPADAHLDSDARLGDALGRLRQPLIADSILEFRWPPAFVYVRHGSNSSVSTCDPEHSDEWVSMAWDAAPMLDVDDLAFYQLRR